MKEREKERGGRRERKEGESRDFVSERERKRETERKVWAFGLVGGFRQVWGREGTNREICYCFMYSCCLGRRVFFFFFGGKSA